MAETFPRPVLLSWLVLPMVLLAPLEAPRADELADLLARTSGAADAVEANDAAVADAIAAGRAIRVSPDNAAGALASLEAALATARGDPGIDTILLADGRYYMPRPLRLEAGDAGLTIAAEPGAEPVLHGGLDLATAEWSTEGDGVYTTRIDTTALPRGVLDLHVDGVRQVQARFPNAAAGDPTSGWLFAAPGTSGHEMLAFHPGDVPDGLTGDDLHILVTDAVQWSSNTVSVAAIDHATHTIHLADNVPWHQVGEGSRYFFFNSQGALDAPNEWHFDAASSTLSYRPADPARLDGSTAIVAATTDSLIEVAGADDVTIHGLTLRDASPHGGDRNYDYLQIGGGAIKVTDAANISLTVNSIENVGVGIALLDVEDVIVAGNTIRHTAGNGIFTGMAWGGRGSHGVTIAGNRISDVGHTFIDGAGVMFQGIADSLIRGNLVERAAQFGVHGMQTRDTLEDPLLRNTIADNVIRDVNLRTADGGGIKLYAAMRGGAVGNIIEGNWIDGATHLMSRPDGSFFAADDWDDSRWPQPISAALYLDWNSEDTVIRGNLVTDSYTGVLLVNSDDTLVEGNVVFGGYGAALEAADQPAADRAPMAGNLFRGNVVVRDEKSSAAVRLYDPTGGPSPAQFENNIYFGEAMGDTAFLIQGRGWGGDLRGDLTAWNADGEAVGEEIIADPGFVDPAGLDFTLQAASPLPSLGIASLGTGLLERLRAARAAASGG